MDLNLRAWLSQPQTRTSLFFFTLFMAPAISSPYLPIWLTSLGLSRAEIGIISATPILIMVFLNMFVGRIADRAGDWRHVIIVGSLIAGATTFGMFLAKDFWSTLVVFALIVVPFLAIVPVVDAASMRMARRLNLDFSYIRVWGTIGFLVVTIGAGFALDRFGFGLFVPMLVIAGLARAFTSLQLPLFRAPAANKRHQPSKPISLEHETGVKPLISNNLAGLLRPWFLLPLVGSALLHSSHMMQMSMGSLLWKEMGVSETMIGVLWALAPAGEIAMFLLFHRLAKRFSARHLLLAACLVAVVRWAGMALGPPVWGIAALQLLHMFTFGLSYLGIVNFIANWTGEDIAAQAQSSFVMIRQVFNVLALTGFGYLAGLIGGQSYFVAALMSGIGGICILWSLRLMNPKLEMDRQRIS